MVPFSELSAAQLKVFEQIATGNDKGHHQRTLDSLERKDMIVSRLYVSSVYPPVAVIRYTVPIPVHIAWCQWCAEQPDEKEQSGTNA